MKTGRLMTALPLIWPSEAFFVTLFAVTWVGQLPSASMKASVMVQELPVQLLIVDGVYIVE